MKLTILVPVYDEETTVTAVLRTLSELDLGEWDKEILVVNDGSTDNTRARLDELASTLSPALRVIHHEKNQGKGAAIRTGFQHSQGDYILIQDADLEYQPEEIKNLLEVLQRGPAKVIYGSRNLNPQRRGYRHYVFGVWALTKLFNFLFHVRLTDLYTCYKLFPTAAAKAVRLQSTGFEFEAEITTALLKSGYQIAEVPISYAPRTFREGKKIKILDGVIGAWTIVRLRLK